MKPLGRGRSLLLGIVLLQRLQAPASLDDIARDFAIAKRNARRWLAALVRAGLAAHDGRTGRARTFWALRRLVPA